MRLYICRKESDIAIKYNTFLLISITSKLSLTIKQNNRNQKLHNEYFNEVRLCCFCRFKDCVKRNSQKEIIKKSHHPGAEAQQLAAQDCTTKINGVIRQWIRHRVLAKAPNPSELFKVNFIEVCLRV